MNAPRFIVPLRPDKPVVFKDTVFHLYVPDGSHQVVTIPEQRWGKYPSRKTIFKYLSAAS